MKKELGEIVEANEIRVANYKKEEEILNSKIQFCEQYNMSEEKRIALIKWEVLSKILYRYEAMTKELRELLNSFNSNVV